ncbi:unnamed protein product [Ceutorhynchus assimilis]|uniref:RHD domain-containing protein n=1 Tax=Ceutorhynchus assimilis TaxID=467358 RepID=A0A9N9MEV4_9CUCU|nr:unnamed protein product [Ceutorhynchus assimilis]
MPPRKSIMVSADLLLELLVQKCRLDDYLNSTTDHIEEAPYDGTHLSDVLEAIKETDPDFVKESPKNQRRVKKSMLNGGGQVVQMPPQQLHQPGVQQSTRNRAEVRIIEQPASKALRFRYECEGRSAGSIPGASSTPENKTFPEIEVVGYKGKAVVVVSCVTKDIPYMVHPHNLVGKEGCKNGVCTVIIPENTMRAQFQNLGIQCVKKRDIESSLRQREQIRVDPFRHGYAHRSQPTSIDLNAVRLCFQVFLENERDGKFTTPLRPVVSDVIYDKKAMSDLTIIKLSDCTSYVDGGRKDIILLCEKVAKEDIEVHFYEKNQQGEEVWHGKADFQPGQVHKQHAIWFRPPRYKTLDISEPVRVFIQLYRPSDQLKSDPLPFELLPLDSVSTNEGHAKRKRAKFDQANQKIIGGLTDKHTKVYQEVFGATGYLEPIKTEPRDSTSPYGNTPPYGGTSPYGGGIMYQEGSPNHQYVPAPAHSPQYMELAPTPSPETMNYPYRHQPVNFNAVPQQIKPDNNMWNMPPQPNNNPQPIAAWNAPTGSGQPHLLDLDNQISSAELNKQIIQMNIPNEFANISLTDIEFNSQSHNMSDSLTNIVNEAVDKNLGG